jgi:hypothetical protein
MLKIRPEHLNALAHQQATGFVERMRLHLREVFATEVAGLDDSNLKALIEKICAQGEQWRITNEALVERLIELFVSFEHLRRNPLPKWVGDIIADKGTNGIRVPLMLEKGLHFGESCATPAELGHAFSEDSFYRRVDRAFYNEIKQEHGGILPPDLLDRNGKARPITISLRDRAYRTKWKTIAAQMRRSSAIPRKSVKSASTKLIAKPSGTKFPSVFLPSQGGSITKVQIIAGRQPRD